MHKPSKFGDNLTGIRQDFEYVNKYKKIVRGFSNGRTAHGFRNVYPIFNDQNVYVGSIEISFSSESLQDYLINLSNLHSHFLIDKHIFDSKAWERDDMILKYYPSAENKNLMFHLTTNHTYEKCIVQNSKNIKKYQTEIQKNLAKNEKFVLYVPDSKDANLICFYPVTQNVTNKVVAWIASYEYVELLNDLKRQKNYNLFWTVVILLILIYFTYKLLIQHQLIKQNEYKLLEKTKEQDTLLSLFDKGETVLFQWNNDTNWSVQHVSKSVQNLFGYSKDEFLNKNIEYFSCIHKDDIKRVKQEVKKGSMANNDFFAHQPYRIITKEKKEKWVIDYTTILRYNNGEVKSYIGYILDITEQKNKESLLFEQSKLASMGEMIGNIAHQWRQPLSIISTSATGLQMQYEYELLDLKTIPKVCESINENAQYLSTTIDDFRNFIKGERKLKDFNIKNTITSFLNLVEPSIKSHNINVFLEVEDNIVLEGYENELQQCFINIFNNSKDVLKELNTEEKLFFITVLEEDSCVKIIFKDNGKGIDENIIDKVFEPYFTTKHQSQGTGLGLHMTYNMITSGMNGTIIIKNVKFEYSTNLYIGAQITITLPKKYQLSSLD
jgi:PAS domain S-box-containing protein